ncbi:MAG TPA: hypothetical protein VFS83_18775, partial [Ktedonobacterales bacterium]|nr:hypothetical protein [Ktedonobacterales bacterium]
MRALLRRLCLAVVTGYIFVYYSEYAFWARPLDNVRFPDALWLLLTYSFAAYVFLTLVVTLRVRSFAALFLAGALFGWLVEGVFVQTMYTLLPFSISLTGLSWHALITILVGWYATQRLLRAGSWWRTFTVAAAIGAVYGLWAIWWWVDVPPATPFSDFAVYAFATTTLLACAYWLASRFSMRRFAPTRIEIVGAILLVVIYFGLVTLPNQPLALIILPPLVLLVLLTLLRNRRIETRDDILTTLGSPRLSHPVRLREIFPVFAIPLVAMAIYGIAQATHVLVPTGPAIYAVTTLAGFV